MNPDPGGTDASSRDVFRSRVACALRQNAFALVIFQTVRCLAHVFKTIYTCDSVSNVQLLLRDPRLLYLLFFYDTGNRTFNGGTSDARPGFLVEPVSVSRKSQEGLGAHSVWSVFHPKGRTPRGAGSNELAKPTSPAHF